MYDGAEAPFERRCFLAGGWEGVADTVFNEASGVAEAESGALEGDEGLREAEARCMNCEAG